MASSAIFSLFTTVEVDGNGALGQLKPLSPALHMGAKKLLTISFSHTSIQANSATQSQPPLWVGGILEHMLDSAFTDAMASDLETIEKLYMLVGLNPSIRVLSSYSSQQLLTAYGLLLRMRAF
jgi:NTE family protein